jgi:hypothetical protein
MSFHKLEILKSLIEANYAYIESTIYTNPKYGLKIAKFIYERKDRLLSITVIYNNYKGENVFIYKHSLDELLSLSENQNCNKDLIFIDNWFNTVTINKLDKLCMSSKLTFFESHYGYIRIPFKKHKISVHRLMSLKPGLEEEYYYFKHQVEQLEQEKTNQCILL